ncbi:hypothetical protein PPERSA_08397 [Pseudocohnilembus persalinus]|uniref:Uncharacterized protein n=1 Tax=Pseudocohnilembus persalinus TaxID=266149 RepID=A0A0V0R693_PSEPJ|nr:hypothetical protein PPERSA_08397 [Pseudocohnilembus persalinus]|eukprot:KRX09996.1 hypothetical protein PPERSA_08397 [Pseudocohnilembus persalinus]
MSQYLKKSSQQSEKTKNDHSHQILNYEQMKELQQKKSQVELKQNKNSNQSSDQQNQKYEEKMTQLDRLLYQIKQENQVDDVSNDITSKFNQNFKDLQQQLSYVQKESIELNQLFKKAINIEENNKFNDNEQFPNFKKQDIQKQDLNNHQKSQANNFLNDHLNCNDKNKYENSKLSQKLVLEMKNEIQKLQNQDQQLLLNSSDKKHQDKNSASQSKNNKIQIVSFSEKQTVLKNENNDNQFPDFQQSLDNKSTNQKEHQHQISEHYIISPKKLVYSENQKNKLNINKFQSYSNSEQKEMNKQKINQKFKYENQNQNYEDKNISSIQLNENQFQINSKKSGKDKKQQINDYGINEYVNQQQQSLKNNYNGFFSQRKDYNQNNFKEQNNFEEQNKNIRSQSIIHEKTNFGDYNQKAQYVQQQNKKSNQTLGVNSTFLYTPQKNDYYQELTLEYQINSLKNNLLDKELKMDCLQKDLFKVKQEQKNLENEFTKKVKRNITIKNVF